MMFTSLVSSTLFATLALAVSLNVPEKISRCDKINIVAKGKGKLNVAVLSAKDECGTAEKEWLNIESDTVHWTADYKVGQQVVFLVEERDGDAEIWSDPITIEDGPEDCAAVASTTNSASASSTDSASSFAPTDSSDASSNVTPPTDSTGSTGNGGAQNVGTTPESNSPTGAASARPMAAFSAVLVGAVAVAASLF
ncbi:hypothetical protein BKA62DRAFT_671591 [Auriculariales sp. MPI-PUGE-AT-0066]|nr:hypothetical protein BKA62DRAFT_671591 [Auriculariales sp. MPI-PUGE-AT-0066]